MLWGLVMTSISLIKGVLSSPIVMRPYRTLTACSLVPAQWNMHNWNSDSRNRHHPSLREVSATFGIDESVSRSVRTVKRVSSKYGCKLVPAIETARYSPCIFLAFVSCRLKCRTNSQWGSYFRLSLPKWVQIKFAGPNIDVQCLPTLSSRKSRHRCTYECPF